MFDAPKDLKFAQFRILVRKSENYNNYIRRISFET